MKLLDPKNDYVFKRLFADAPDLLAELISAIRRDCPPITELKVLNPTIAPSELTGKYIVLDILAADVTGERYNVEIQVKKFAAWGARSAYYLARMLSQQLEQGEQYQRVAPVVGIHLLDFDLFVDYPDDYAWRFEMRDRTYPEVKLGDEFQLDILELRKADRHGVASEHLQNWLTFIEHWDDLVNQSPLDYEPVRRAMEKLKQLSEDEEIRRLAFVRERALHDEATLLYEAREEGREVGERTGEQRGERKGVEASLKRLVRVKFGDLPGWAEARIDEASLSQQNTWLEAVITADSLNFLNR